MKVKHLFNKLNETFPLRLMGDNFQGSHSLTNRGEQMDLAVWTLGKVFVFGLTDEDLNGMETEEGCDHIVNSIVQYLNQNHQSK